ncbi:Fur family transcriptional regulator [Arenibaculum pallidiluteum]|uniref:Fur family transcriptional regulator n=1 Tax=Arenibaculum pallidiluteum TaxID=2812559 RepID=UPI001A97039C|nr:Fur family transcriptional regulator [Arenibaculum pallidiluteum]
MAEHDHDLCIRDALDSAEALCARRGARLTTLRRRVLELVWQSHRPVGAYDLLARLGEGRDRAAPPTVYRALDFLMEQGLVHRIHSLNAFVGCPSAREGHAARFLICTDCGEATEFEDEPLQRDLERIGTARGFRIDGQVIELQGLCSRCAAERPVA